MVDAQQHHGFNELCLDSGSADGEDGLSGEHGGAFGDGPDVTGELEVLQVVQKFFHEAAFGTEVFDVLVRKGQVLDVVYHLFQTCGDGETAFVRNGAEEHIKVGDAVFQRRLEVAVCHGQLIEVA